jgi:hypothetical protein
MRHGCAMSAADVMERYVAAARAGDFDTAFGFFAEVVDVPRANVYRVHGDEIVEIWIFEGDQYAVDALLGGAS